MIKEFLRKLKIKFIKYLLEINLILFVKDVFK